MIRINLYCIGTLKEDYFIKMCLEYLKRLQKFAKISVFEFKEYVFSGNENNNNLEIKQINIKNTIKQTRKKLPLN